MERLTNVGTNGDIYLSNNDYTRRNGRRESAYQKLKEYEDLDEQELLLRLPCKVGTTVYVKMASYCELPYVEAEVRDFTHFTSCGFCAVITSKHFDKQNIPFSEFGKTVFLTQAEVE